MSDLPFVLSILHPTDFTAGNDLAFVHALKIATAARGGARFTIIHADVADASSRLGPKGPGVRTTLERWGMLEPGSESEDVFNALGLAVEEVAAGGPVVNALNEYIVTHPVDLLVMVTRSRDGLPRWIRPSVSERLARLSKKTTLFVPHGARGFIAADDGAARLRHVLIPIVPDPTPSVAVRAARGLARTLSSEPVRFDLLHVGGDEAASGASLVTDVPDDQFKWHALFRSGDVVDEILAAATERQVDLIAMSTRGHHGFLDALRGSATEQVVRRAACPVLAAPVTAQTQRLPLLSFDTPAVVPSTA